MTIFKNTQLKDQYGFSAENTPMDEVRVAKAVRLVGSAFSPATGLTPTTGTTGTDPNFWTGTNANSATIAQAGNQVLMSSGTNAAASSILQSIRLARYVGSISNRFRGVIQLGDTGVASNTRRWGMFDGTDGAYFELAGTTFSACVLKGGSRTAVAALSAPTTGVTSYEIYVNNAKVWFVVGGVLVATHLATTATWANTLTLPCRMDNISSGSTTNCTIAARSMTISRLGEIETASIYKNITGGTSSVICKYGAGRLHRIIIATAVNGATIAIYDNVSGTGSPLGTFTLPNSFMPATIEYSCDFYTGLNIVPSSATLSLTVIYE